MKDYEKNGDSDDSLYKSSGGGRMDKHTGSNPDGGGMSKKAQTNELPEPDEGDFMSAFKRKNAKPFGC